VTIELTFEKLQTMLRNDPGEYNSNNGGVEGTVKLLSSRAGTCCRGSLVDILKSHFATQNHVFKCRFTSQNVNRMKSFLE